MAPTILPNERIYLQKWPPASLARFDVVVISSPRLERRITKRIIGLPGERIRLVNSWQVYINDRPFSYADAASNRRLEAADHLIEWQHPGGPVFATAFNDCQLGPDEYFVLGDNRLASRDSRVFGPVHRAEIQGRLGRIWYSMDLQNHRLRWARFFRSVNASR